MKRTAQKELNLRVQTAQVIVRPALHGIEQLRVDAKQERFSVRHEAVDY